MSRRKQLLSVFLLLLVGCGWVGFRFALESFSHPSDESLIARFHAHRDHFEQLRNMANEDHDLLAVYTDHVMFTDYRRWPQDCDRCFSRQRFDLYRNLLGSLSDNQLHILHTQPGVQFVPVSFNSTEPDGDGAYVTSEKGYAYLPSEPAALVESLDGMGFESKGLSYRKVADHWYLYHERGFGKPE